MNNESIQIRELLPEDIESAMGLVLAEGWNQTEKDWQLLTSNPLNYCFVAEVEGKVVGTATAINYSNMVAWIGMVLVNKDYRGRGISKILLSTLFDKLKSCISIKLDATLAGQPIYEKLGFKSEYLIARLVNISFESSQLADFRTIPQKIQVKDIPSIIEFDKHAFGSDRTQLIRSLVLDYPEKSYFLKKKNKISGFILGRKGNKYHHIGPVSAQSSDTAKLLIAHVLKTLCDQPIVIDILDDKQELTEWLTTAGFVKQRSFTRMFLKSNSFPGEIGFQYLITGPEFG
jgi:GNAT superfamily N-acetyltransferase